MVYGWVRMPVPRKEGDWRPKKGARAGQSKEALHTWGSKDSKRRQAAQKGARAGPNGVPISQFHLISPNFRFRTIKGVRRPKRGARAGQARRDA